MAERRALLPFLILKYSLSFPRKHTERSSIHVNEIIRHVETRIACICGNDISDAFITGGN
jgi:hypothetical protein